MGGKQTSPFTIRDGWVILDSKPHAAYNLATNPQTHQFVRIYSLYFPNLQSLQFQKRTLTRRQTMTLRHIVRLLDFREEEVGGLCNSGHKMTVVTQNFHTTLQEYSHLTQPHAVRILHEALLGFKKIRQVFGNCFAVTDQMIGFTVDGTVKVWFHSKLEESSPEVLLREEEGMVQSMIGCIEKHSQSCQLWRVLRVRKLRSLQELQERLRDSFNVLDILTGFKLSF